MSGGDTVSIYCVHLSDYTVLKALPFDVVGMYSSSAKQLRGKNLTNDDTMSLHEYEESKRSGDFCLVVDVIFVCFGFLDCFWFGCSRFLLGGGLSLIHI